MKIPRNLRRSLNPLGRLLIIIGATFLIPILVGIFYSEWSYQGNIIYLAYLVPAALSIGLGVILTKKFEQKGLNLVQGLLLTGFAWIIISLFCSIPFYMLTDLGAVNSFFESVSGFTTTGMTMFVDLSSLPLSLLFWRSMIQWVGGLGIITFFLFIGKKGISEHILYRGESHKIETTRPVPNISKTIKYLWAIYGGFTLVLTFLLWAEGTSFYDAITHAFTTLSTGGFSTHNLSIGYFRANGFAHANLIEYTIMIFMFIGGTNFVVHYRVLKGKIASLWDNLEMKMWLTILGASTFLIMFEAGFFNGTVELHFRNTAFQVVSIATTTGYETTWIGSPYFGALAKQLFLILMVIGGCVSSTAGGLKVRRIGIMIKGIWNRVKKASRPREMLTPLTVDGEKVDRAGLERIFIIFGSWIFLLVIGGLVTALLSGHGPFECFSGMFSALGNIGPSFLEPAELVALNPGVKLFYTFGMLVGRLEILPIFILLNREVWKE